MAGSVTGRRSGREVEEGVVKGEVVAMVDPGEMVEKSVRKKWGRVEAVHEQIERCECSQRSEHESNTTRRDEVQDLLHKRGRGRTRELRRFRCRRLGFRQWLQIPEDRSPVDEWVDFKMHRQPQQHPRQPDPPMNHGPEQRDDHNAQQTLGAPARADRGHHRVEQPDGGKLERPFRRHAATGGRLEDQDNEPSGDDVREGEQDLAV